MLMAAAGARTGMDDTDNGGTWKDAMKGSGGDGGADNGGATRRELLTAAAVRGGDGGRGHASDADGMGTAGKGVEAGSPATAATPEATAATPRPPKDAVCCTACPNKVDVDTSALSSNSRRASCTKSETPLPGDPRNVHARDGEDGLAVEEPRLADEVSDSDSELGPPAAASNVSAAGGLVDGIARGYSFPELGVGGAWAGGAGGINAVPRPINRGSCRDGANRGAGGGRFGNDGLTAAMVCNGGWGTSAIAPPIVGATAKCVGAVMAKAVLPLLPTVLLLAAPSNVSESNAGASPAAKPSPSTKAVRADAASAKRGCNAGSPSFSGISGVWTPRTAGRATEATRRVGPGLF